MSAMRPWLPVVGLVIHVLIGVALLLAGGMKALGFVPAEALEPMMGIGDNIRLIGCGAIASGLLLIIPRTASLGILLCSSYWGGAICLHMFQREAYVMQAAFLLFTWIGAYLRYPAMFASFWEGVQTPTAGAPVDAD